MLTHCARPETLGRRAAGRVPPPHLSTGCCSKLAKFPAEPSNDPVDGVAGVLHAEHPWAAVLANRLPPSRSDEPLNRPGESGDSVSWKVGVMSGSKSTRYPAELRERAVRMVAEIRADHDSEWAAMAKVAEVLGVGRRRPSGSGAARPRSTPAGGRE